MCVIVYVHPASTPCAFILTDATQNDTVEEGNVRLVGGNTPNIGRVEIFLLGQWGTVCGYGWDIADATVVCHELGYLRAVAVPSSGTFGAGSGPSWYSYVGCAGTEMNLTECEKSFSTLGSACSHSQDAGVECSSEPYTVCHPLFVRIPAHCTFLCKVLLYTSSFLIYVWNA